MLSNKSDKMGSIRSADIQASNQQWTYTARTHKLGDNLSRSVLMRKNAKFATSAIKDPPTSLQAEVNGKLKLLSSPISDTGGKIRASTAKGENLQSSLMALGALSAFGAASYGMLRNHWERNNLVQDVEQRSRIQRERRDRERLENEHLFQMAATGVLLALVIFALMYVGWFYLVLAVVISFALLVCALS
ncbi:hypothetical protein PRIC1_011140 [Phytophthora ramorum]